ncbi:sodium/potassium-transporting ATPase subunit beta-2a isoform X1 [Osmerus eperlanus]|uniref:sodium/potassium-transporting ATPase subunit beta-2a isoform X1 n=1 Tax=Osmerus eperlanus TaxID=29151 RepID=UPI002E0D7CDF
MAKEDERKGSGEWKEFFWNPRTHEFLGRTASSWGLILLFYLVFYIFLAGMFVLTMYVMLLSLDDYQPTYQDRLTTPGMMIRPRGEALEIVYNRDDPDSWRSYATALDIFLSPYNDSQQARTNDLCVPDRYFVQEDSGEVRNNPKRSCQFNLSTLEECSGLSDPSYGYAHGKPCVLIKLNRVIGMLPGKDGQSPYVSCGAKKYKVGKGEWKEDSDSIGELSYFPPNGTFNLMYFPYYGKRAQVNYTQPLVAVKFQSISMNTDVNIECQINSNTIATGNERDKFAGRVSFKLRISTKD